MDDNTKIVLPIRLGPYRASKIFPLNLFLTLVSLRYICVIKNRIATPILISIIPVVNSRFPTFRVVNDFEAVYSSLTSSILYLRELMFNWTLLIVGNENRHILCKGQILNLNTRFSLNSTV